MADEAIWQDRVCGKCISGGSVKIPEFDDFDGEELGNWYYAPRIMPQRFADVKARPGYVRLRGQESRTS